MKKVIVAIALSLFALVLGACNQNKPNYTPTNTTNYVTHTVRYPGETLSIIASWYTGSSRNWNQILEHNPGLDVRRIRVGNDIQIPDYLVVKNTPMPKTFLDSLAKGNSKAAQELAESTAEEKQAALTQPPPSEQPNLRITDTPEEKPAEQPSEVTATTDAPTALNEPPPTQEVSPQEQQKKEIRLKTRDELLKELLDE